jgi:antitoxin component YwqK of YwqJK toxin-antitoxin module
MKRKIFFILLSIGSFSGYSQNNSENILYIVDSVPIIEEPEEEFATLTENDIDHINVVKNKEAIKATGYTDFDGIIYVFTKAFVQREDSIKAIPTTLLMIKKNGTWYKKGNSQPYTGPFIDYFLNGSKQGEGTLFQGKLKGKRLRFYINGSISDETEYENGIANGLEQQFYQDGTLKQKGIFKDGKEIGVWEMYHPNGRLKQISTFSENGKMDGEAISYYSTGMVKGKSIYVNGNYQKDKKVEKMFTYYNQSQEMYQQGNYKGAINKLNDALELDSTWEEAYFARGTMKLNDFQFDEAVLDFNKTLEIEPYFTNAYANRAFAIIRKYEFGNSRTLSKTNEVQVLATQEFEIPENDLEKICLDLEKAVSLGDDGPMVLEALKEYCK